MTNAARQAILSSIRSHLATSAPFDKLEQSLGHEDPVNPDSPAIAPQQLTPVELFKQSLESVDGHCLITNGDEDIVRTLTQIITALQQTKLRAQRIAISDAPDVDRLLQLTDLEIEELSVTPNAHDIFGFDVGISTAQAAIAETGTIVLDCTQERHRLLSLVPPVHIAIVDASKIYSTLGETLALLQAARELSPAVTFITGPSRTADIELTLTIGVHGPQELYVIINGST